MHQLQHHKHRQLNKGKVTVPAQYIDWHLQGDIYLDIHRAVLNIRVVFTISEEIALVYDNINVSHANGITVYSKTSLYTE